MLDTLFSISFEKNIPTGYGNFAAIYRIRNKLNGKFYIGSTINFKNRFYQHRSTARRKVNSHLSHAVNQYGREQFSYELVEIVADKKQLIQREQHYIDTLCKPLPFQDYYNARIENVSKNLNVENVALRQRFEVVGPDGKTYQGHGIKNFICEEKRPAINSRPNQWNVKDSSCEFLTDSDVLSFGSMLRGESKHCKGWHLPATNPNDIFKHLGRRKTFILESPEGELVEFTGVQEFEEKYDVHGVSNLLNPDSNIICLKGWVVPGTDRSTLARRHDDEFTLKEISTGKLCTYQNITKFCKDFGIPEDSHHIASVITGERLASNGFCLPDTNVEEVRKVKDESFYIKDPTGKIHVGNNYTNFADEYGLNHKSISALFLENSGKDSHKGWEPSSEADYVAQQNGAPLVPYRKKKTRYWLGKKRDIETVHKKIETHLLKEGLEGYLLSDVSGEIFFTKYLVEFCDDMGIRLANARRARYQGKEIMDGWKRFDRGENQKFIKVVQIGEEVPDPTIKLNLTLLEDVTEVQRIAKKQIAEGYYGWMLKDKNGEIHVFNLDKFCRERKMHSRVMQKNAKRGREYKGYSVRKNLVIPPDYTGDIAKRFNETELYLI